MSIKIKVYNQKAEATGEMKLKDQVFGVKVNEALVHQAMVTQMANERQVLAHTKQRAEVRGGGRKPWRQKGTGRARAGSNRSPIWMGGGVTFGPTKERNFKKKINTKMKQLSLKMVLSDKLVSKHMAVLDKLETKEFKTKAMDEIISKLEKKALKQKPVARNKKGEKAKSRAPKRSMLLVIPNKDEKVKYSIRNLTGTKTINVDNINILDLLNKRDLILTKGVIKKLEEKYK